MSFGRYQGSGCIDSPHLLRRADGQMLTVPRLLYLVVASIDGRRDLDDIAESLTTELGRGVSRDHVGFLIDEKLAPSGVVLAQDGSRDEAPSALVLSLSLRGAILPHGVVNTASSVLSHLFRLPLTVTVLAGILAFDTWFFAVHGVGGGLSKSVRSSGDGAGLRPARDVGRVP